MAAANSIVKAMRSTDEIGQTILRYDHKGIRIPDFTDYSVNLSLPLIRSNKLKEVIQIYTDGLDTASLILELPESMNQTTDLEKVKGIAIANPQIRFAIDDLYSEGSSVGRAQIIGLKTWLKWLKVDFKYWKWVRLNPNDVHTLIEELKSLQNLQCEMVIEGIETKADRQFLADQLRPVDVPKTVFIQGLDVHNPEKE